MTKHSGKILTFLFLFGTPGCVSSVNVDEVQSRGEYPPPKGPRAPLDYEETQGKELLGDHIGYQSSLYKAFDPNGALSRLSVVGNILEADPDTGTGSHNTGTGLIGYTVFSQATFPRFIPNIDVIGGVLTTASNISGTMTAMAKTTEPGDDPEPTPRPTRPRPDPTPTPWPTPPVIPAHTARLVIEDVQLAPAWVDPLVGNTYMYKVRANKKDANGNWIDAGPLCDTDATYAAKDASGNNWIEYALVIPSVWNNIGDLQNATDNPANANPNLGGGFSFACMKGVAAKCFRFGYVPNRAKGNVTGPEMTMMHQACTEMARAHYCRDGISRTKEGTPVEIYDEAGLRHYHGDRVLPGGVLTPVGGAAVAFMQKQTDPTTGIETVIDDPVIIGNYEVEFEHAPQFDQYADPKFEGAWDIQGPACLSRTRWADILLAKDCEITKLRKIRIPACHSRQEAEAVTHGGFSKYHVYNDSDLQSINPPILTTTTVNTNATLSN